MEWLVLSEAELAAWLGAFLWPLFRIGGFLMAAPVLGSDFVPVRVRLILSVILALVVAPLVGPLPAVEALSLEAGLIVLQQVLIGAALGFFLQIVFHLFVLAGQMIAMQMGLGFASMVDPATGVNTAILGTVYFMVAMLLFISFNGHLIMISVLTDSFLVLPVGTEGFARGVYMTVVTTIGWAFANALVLALPAVTALLLTNFAFGVMTRAAPQMNMFALGFPSALMLGLFVVWLVISSTGDAMSALFNEAFLVMRSLLPLP